VVCSASRTSKDQKISDLGLIHTRYFRTQYCDKKIKRYIDKKNFLKNIVIKFQNNFKLGSKINISTHTGKK